jgi:hypothetical protein
VAGALLVALALLALPASAAHGHTTVGFWAGEAVPGTNWHRPGTYWKPRDLRPFRTKVWRTLQRYRIPLYLNLRYKRDFGPVPRGKPRRYDGLEIIEKANRLGVPVWGWVLIPYSDGYWAWEGAAKEQFKAVKSLVRWSRAQNLRLRGLVIDPEPPVGTPSETAAAFIGGAGEAIQALFPHTIDPAAQCAAWRRYARMPIWAKRNGVRLAAAPTPAVLDDLADDRLALQDAAQFLVPKAPWRPLFFQAYRSTFDYHGGFDPGSGIVSSYLRSARREFGKTGQITLGSAGRGKYVRLSRLVHDVRVAASMGAREVPIYSLERTLRAYGGRRALARLAWAARHPFRKGKRLKAIAPTMRAEGLRAAIQSSDVAATEATPNITMDQGKARPANTTYSCRKKRTKNGK